MKLKKIFTSSVKYEKLLFNSFFSNNLCSKSENCLKMEEIFNVKLVGRYIYTDKPFKNQIVSAVLNLPNSINYYIKNMRSIHKGNAVRTVQKAIKLGYFCERFNEKTFISDIIEIHHSKEERQGRKMDSHYLINLDEMGGYPKIYFKPNVPKCNYHWHTIFGVFLKINGYKQGEIITNKQLIGYVSLERNGELLLYSRIIGHGDHLKNGIMYLLNQEIIRWIIDGKSQVTDGIKYIMYAGWNDGTAGLKMWKKRTLFKPYYLQV